YVTAALIGYINVSGRVGGDSYRCYETRTQCLRQAASCRKFGDICGGLLCNVKISSGIGCDSQWMSELEDRSRRCAISWRRGRTAGWRQRLNSGANEVVLR